MSLRTAIVILCLMAGINIGFTAGYVIPRLQGATASNCARLHRLVDAGIRILDTPANLQRAYRAGTLTSEEYRLGLEQVHRFDPLRVQNIARWRSADCQP